MASLQVVSIYDKKLEEYHGVYLVRNLAVAVRMFSDGFADSDTEINKHPEDFALYVVGEFEPETGLLRSVSYPQLVIEAAEIVRRKAPRDDDTLEIPFPKSAEG